MPWTKQLYEFVLFIYAINDIALSNTILHNLSTHSLYVNVLTYGFIYALVCWVIRKQKKCI